MSRMFALLCLISASVLVAAPAPVPKPKETGPWFDGWEKPVEPKKDCHFDRDGAKLTITVPGRGHKLDLVRDRPTWRLGADSAAPMLLREVEGDFTVRFRVAGAVAPAPQGHGREAFTAGLVLLDGNKTVQHHLSYPVNKKPMYMLIQRRGDKVSSKSSSDGVTWPDDPDASFRIQASQKLRIAIVASSNGDGVFKAEFDQLEITGGKAAGK
jgi:regulation of enolase protein 1 (concanavalin A-like superfamily)